MPIDITRIELSVFIQNIIDLRVRSDRAQPAARAFRTKRSAHISRHFPHTPTRNESHLIIEVLLDVGVRTAKIPFQILVIDRCATGQRVIA